jgi:hypothetical protein
VTELSWNGPSKSSNELYFWTLVLPMWHSSTLHQISTCSETFCTILDNPNAKPTVAFTLHPIMKDEGSERGDKYDESTKNDGILTDGNLGQHQLVVTDFNLQGFQDGTTPP